MHLLALNLQQPSAINTAIYGNFSAPKSQEIAVVRGSNAIELLRPDDTGKLVSICLTPMFAIVRSILPFRLAGANRDYLIVGSDAGKISILEFDTTINGWKLLHCEVYGKTGCRRIVPGQYVAADPKGRAIMIGAIEKQRFVYVMNRDSANRLTISSPLEAHRSETICYHICGVDVGFDNPVFAVIEMEYTEADQDPSGVAAQEAEKKLTYYELDLGLNHVVRKWSEPISRTANILLPVPGGDDGPSGVLICGENWISYKNQNHVEIRAALPRRVDMPVERGLLITTGTVHKQKDLFFFLVQTELGDLYKVTLSLNPSDNKLVDNIHVTVFDSIPPAVSLCITKTGLLFAASELGNHILFQFQGIGDDPNAVKSEKVPDEMNEELGDDSMSAAQVAPIFKASDKLTNLLITDDISSLCPITDILIDDVAKEDSKQIYTLCGRGNRSTLRILRHGVSVTEIAVSELPGRPTAVWTVKKSVDSEYDRFIIVSFSNATLVLSIGDTVEEVTDSGFMTSASTLQVVLLRDQALLQVHTNGIRHIRPDQRASEWKTPGKRSILKAAVNSSQVAVALAGGMIVYLELDSTGHLLEMGSVEIDKDIACIDLGLVPEGRIKSSFMAIGFWDNTVQVLSLDTNNLLTQQSAMSVPARPESVCLVQMMKDRGTNITGSSNNTNSSSSSSTSASSSSSSSILSNPPTLYLNVGLTNGVLVRVAVDPVVGSLSDSRQRFLGPKPIKLIRVIIKGQQGILALTTRPWLMYNYQGRYFQAPISYDALESASSFASEVCPEGIVAVAGNTLRIITVDNLGEMFNQTTHPLRYTPRKLVRIPNTNDIILIESDHNEYNEAQKANISAQISNRYPNLLSAAEVLASSKKMKRGQSNHANVDGNRDDVEEQQEEEEEEEGTYIPCKGPLPPTDGVWASCIRIMEAGSGQTKGILELSNNEAALSLCICNFTQISEESFVVVGVAKDLKLSPKQFTSCVLRVYRILDGGSLQFLHETDVEDIPLAMCEFQGKLLVGIGKCLRLFELGKRKLLRKAENRLFPTSIVRLRTMGDRIYVGDLAESVHYVKYKRDENIIVIFADDTLPRYVTAMCVLDYDTVGVADKFGNVFVLRLPENTNDDVENPAGTRVIWDQGLLNGAPNKVQILTHYYVGAIVTTLTKTAMIPGGTEVMIATTITGGIYAFIPFYSKQDITFFQHLEMFMRQEAPSLCQRDHLSYRSYYQPVKETIDGDLCERFGSLSYVKQKEFGDDVDRTPMEILKKLEDTRNIL